MRRVLIIGIGPGGPGQLTVEAIEALRSVDVFLVADKSAEGDGASDLVRLRRDILERHVPDGGYRFVEIADPVRDRMPASYRRAVEDWHEERAVAYEGVLRDEVPDGSAVGFLVWGDPALYDSTIRVVERVRARGDVPLEVEVVPGISALQILASRHRLVLNGIGEPITITTGRRLPEAIEQGRDNLVVMLDGGLACADLADGGRWDIWWGANLGTPGEALVAGPLREVLDDIRTERAAVKRDRGWVMDTYLLRRRG